MPDCAADLSTFARGSRTAATCQIAVRNLAVYAFVGVHAEEKRLGQRLYLDIICDIDRDPLAMDDRLEQSVDYAAVIGVARALAEEARFNLLETLAAALARTLFERFDSVRSIDIEIRKPAAPVDAILDHCAARIVCQRGKGRMTREIPGRN